MPKYRMNTSLPVRKVRAAGWAGAASALLIWLLNTYVLAEPMPADIAAALATLVATAAAYLTRPERSERVVREEEGRRT